MAKYLYFSGNTELKSTWSAPNKQFLELGGVKSKHNACDSFSRRIGHDGVTIMPVTRTIRYKSNPSLHKCDARCMNATGHDCECSCGGKNHGAGA